MLRFDKAEASAMANRSPLVRAKAPQRLCSSNFGFVRSGSRPPTDPTVMTHRRKLRRTAAAVGLEGNSGLGTDETGLCDNLVSDGETGRSGERHRVV